MASGKLVTPGSSPLSTWRYNAQSGVTSVSISQDGQRVLAGTLGKTAVCLDSSGHLLWEQPVGNQAWRVGLSRAGETAVVGTGSTRFWDMKGRALSCFDGDGSLRWQQDLEASVWGLAISADGRTIAVGTSAKQLLLFDGQGHLLWQQDVPGVGWYAWVWSVSLSDDGEVIAAGAADKHIRVLRRNGELLAEHRTRADVFTTAVSAEGNVIGAGDSSGYIYCLDRNGHLLWEKRLADKVWGVTLSADGQRLLVGAGDKEAHVRVYNRGGQLLWKRHVGGAVTNVGLSSDGRRIVVGTRDGSIFIFDEDQVLHQERVEKIVRDVAISVSGQWTVAGSEDGIVYGFYLPPLPPVPEQNATQSGAKYNITITGGQGLVIGDYAQVSQTFNNPTQIQKESIKTTILYLELALDFHQFGLKEQNQFIIRLSRIIGTSSDNIHILAIDSGSVLITLEVPEEAAAILISMFMKEEIELKTLQIMKVETRRFPAEGKTSNIHIDEQSKSSIKIEQIDLAKLRECTVLYFNESELKDVCFDLGVDFENLSGQGKNDKARELVAYFVRRRQIEEFVSIICQRRPKIAILDLIQVID